ncbi:hypothetical protein OG471_00920 [Streptomyces sp. NBC_01336]|uniref:hypothetical protein n=1 Tax=Streptomyces sp. NBC_01336 TaxID=2903829 RepID=UPI002E110330|nr:hypothetical protein OG471_00920 [Streptomyces sp. NBC_01336]
MTEILTPPATHSPLAFLFDIVATTARLNREEECDGAETAAADHVYSAFPDTVGRALEHDAWTGYPALRDEAIAPSAVAYLDGGLWLHHTITHDADYRDVLTLIVPCTCGRGYAALQLEDESDLLEVLDELRTAAGRSAHGGDTGGLYCASTTG